MTEVTLFARKSSATHGVVGSVYRIVCGGILISALSSTLSMTAASAPVIAGERLDLGWDVGVSVPDLSRQLGVDMGPAAPTQRMRDRATRRSAVRTYGTTRTPAEAVSTLKAWAEQAVGGYWGQCLRLADDAYMPSGPRTATAWDQWHRARKAGLAHPKDHVVPVGAHMFWDTENSAGHIATHVGGGKVVTNTPGGSVEIMDWRELNDWGPYVGWASPYYK